MDARPSTIRRLLDSDLYFSFRSSPVAIGATVVAMLMIVGAVFAPWVAPHQPFDLASLNLNDSLIPPAWAPEGSASGSGCSPATSAAGSTRSSCAWPTCSCRSPRS
jgi:ABC-type antimicrobial peptide transport system permease subunit